MASNLQQSSQQLSESLSEMRIALNNAQQLNFSQQLVYSEELIKVRRGGGRGIEVDGKAWSN